MRRRWCLLTLAAAAAIAAAPASGADPAPGTPGWYARAVANHVYADGRGLDQAANPDYAQREAPLIAAYFANNDQTVLTDPYRLNWSGSRGMAIPISYRNRYGARIRGHLWRPKLPWHDPVTGLSTGGPLPAVVVVPGLGSNEREYWGPVQQLAESGYVVMSFDPQGQGASDFAPSPASTYCDPHGAWRRPQEVGIRERGTCAGEIPPLPNPTPSPIDPLVQPLVGTPAQPVADDAGTVAFLLGNHTRPKQVIDATAQAFEFFRPNFVFGALDAVAWLRSAADPWRSLVDVDRIGLAGHSAGSDGAVVAANGDPEHRFVAAVAWDDFGDPPPAMSPTVPTLIQQAEQENFLGPYTSPPDPHLFHSYRIFGAFRAAGVPTMEIALRGSTHQEFDYLPYSLVNPLAPLADASSKGQEVAVYYTLAWFDRYLKGRTDTVQAASARRRLVARRFDRSTDRSSIGQGRWSVLAQRNVPYRIGGERVADRLSFYFPSLYAFDGLACADLRRRCRD